MPHEGKKKMFHDLYTGVRPSIIHAGKSGLTDVRIMFSVGCRYTTNLKH